jgi:hypothetical protein
MSETEHPAQEPAQRPNGAQPDRGRRALLKGVALSAPAVVTLTSGSAWAASLTCFERNGGRPGMTEDEKKKFIEEYSLNCYLSGGPIGPGPQHT